LKWCSVGTKIQSETQGATFSSASDFQNAVGCRSTTVSGDSRKTYFLYDLLRRFGTAIRDQRTFLDLNETAEWVIDSDLVGLLVEHGNGNVRQWLESSLFR